MRKRRCHSTDWVGQGSGGTKKSHPSHPTCCGAKGQVATDLPIGSRTDRKIRGLGGTIIRAEPGRHGVEYSLPEEGAEGALQKKTGGKQLYVGLPGIACAPQAPHCCRAGLHRVLNLQGSMAATMELPAIAAELSLDLVLLQEAYVQKDCANAIRYEALRG